MAPVNVYKDEISKSLNQSATLPVAVVRWANRLQSRYPPPN
jgi:hypothetical protein